MAKEEQVVCGCGKSIGISKQKMHETSKGHKAWVIEFVQDVVADNPSTTVVKVDLEPTPLHEGLQSVVDIWKQGPIAQARQARKVFSWHDWPNSEQPLTVREFLISQDIPLIDTPEGFSDGQMRTYALQREKELMHGRN